MTQGVRLSHIGATICREFRCSQADLRYGGRLKALVTARYCAWWLARDLTNCSYPAIGAFFGFDHSTVVHGVRAYAARLKGDPALRQRTMSLRRALLGMPDRLDTVAPSQLRLRLGGGAREGLYARRAT